MALALLGKIATYGDALGSLEESYLFALHAADAGDAEAIEMIAEAARIYLETVAAGHPGTEAP